MSNNTTITQNSPRVTRSQLVRLRVTPQHRVTSKVGATGGLILKIRYAMLFLHLASAAVVRRQVEVALATYEATSSKTSVIQHAACQINSFYTLANSPCRHSLRYISIYKIWGFRGSDYEECRLLGYKNPFRTSQETHYVSTTECSQLMLCKIWGFRGGDYEEWCLLGYKNPFRTSQETHYISTTESSQLILCKIWGFHGGDYEEWCLLGCYAVWLL
jgi:hypothetical protein